MAKDGHTPRLRLDELTVHGLAPVSFAVTAGACVAVTGPSGSGKTVLLRAVADLDPAEGRVYLDGAERTAMSGPAWRRRIRFSAAEPGWWADTPGSHLPGRESVASAVAALGLTTAQRDQALTELSTGERQRFALIRALADKPSVLLLDEPTGALDAQATERAEHLLRSFLDGGGTVLFTSHDHEQVGRLASRCLAIRDGAVREEAV